MVVGKHKDSMPGVVGICKALFSKTCSIPVPRNRDVHGTEVNVLLSRGASLLYIAWNSFIVWRNIISHPQTNVSY